MLGAKREEPCQETQLHGLLKPAQVEAAGDCCSTLGCSG